MELVAAVLTPKDQFQVIAQAYSLSKLQGKKNLGNLTAIGKELGLEDQEIQSVRLKAMTWARRRPLQPRAEDKSWIWPTPAEERQHQAA